MGKSRGNQYFWHVPPGGWYEGSPVIAAGVGNFGNDIVVPLVDAETAAISSKPEIDNFIVERVIGQYMISTNESIGTQRFMHHRVYVADADLATIALRVLDTASEAETSFLWHKVEYASELLAAAPGGTWQNNGPVDSEQGAVDRRGSFDIRVGRRVEQGTALLWHTQLEPAPVADDLVFLKLWVRLLVREG